MLVGKDGARPIISSSPHGNLPSILLTETASGNTGDLQPAAKPVLDPQKGERPSLAPNSILREYAVNDFLSVSS